MPHRFEVAVRWSDEDRLGHVNNTRYLTFTEDARLVWFGGSPRGNAGVILARTEIDFRRQVHFVTGGRLEVLTSVTRVGRTSIGVQQQIVHPEDAVVVADSRHVLVSFDYAAQAPRPWDHAERDWLAGFAVPVER